MNVHDDLDRRLDAALLDGPSRAPERSVGAALAYAHAHPRRRDPLAILRKDPMNAQSSRFAVALQPLPLVAMLALVLAAGLAVASAGGFFDDRSVVVPPVATSSPIPSPVPSVPASPAPSASPLVPASPAVISVDLVERVGADATIDITDRSGRLVRAESGNPADGASVPDGTVAVTGLAASPATIVLTWSGLPCDTTHQLTIDPDGLTMTIERPACQGDAMGVDHVLVLTFDRPVDATAVRAAIATAEASIPTTGMWVAASVAGNSTLARTAPWIRFDGSNLSGSTGCNDFAATVASDNTGVAITNLSITGVACRTAALHEQERLFIETLRNVGTMARSGNRLRLAGDLGTIELVETTD